MIVRCPACGEEIKCYVTITILEDVFDEKHAPLILTTAKYNPMRTHWEKAGHNKESWKHANLTTVS